MGGRVDPAGQPADDRVAGPGEAAAELFGDLDSVGRGMPRPDDGHPERVGRQDRAPRTKSMPGGSSIRERSGG